MSNRFYVAALTPVVWLVLQFFVIGPITRWVQRLPQNRLTRALTKRHWE